MCAERVCMPDRVCAEDAPASQVVVGGRTTTTPWVRCCARLQVGAQDVAMGVKFSAACTLKCEEFLDGVPEELLSADPADMDSRFPVPSSAGGDCTCRDITFALVEGDFKV